MAKFTSQVLPINAAYSPLIQESGKNSAGVSTFQCPANTVITGRWHQGDENGNTQYQYSQLIAGALICYYTDTEVSEKIQESGKNNNGESSFICPQNAVIVGRWHQGDENGDTQYRYAYLYYNETQMVTKNPIWSDWIQESGKDTGGASTFDCPPNTAITGREHKGDENGTTRYQFAEIYLGDDDSQVLLGRTTDSYTSNAVKESAGVWVNAPENKVMTGRQHKGDENGQTTYEFSYLYLKIPGNELETMDAQWSSWVKESDSNFECPDDTVMIGRQHTGDENGDTRYSSASIRLGTSPNPCVVVEETTSDPIKESAGVWALAPTGEVMTGRKHSGDENGMTTYTYSAIQLEAMAVPTDKTINWMSGLNDTVLISQINIPGTHDSAAINQYIYTPYATQGLTITDQLKSGIRMLDVRIRVDAVEGGYTFYTCHGAIGSTLGLNTYQTLASLFDEVTAFLAEQSTETVLMSLKIDDPKTLPIEIEPAVYTALADFLGSYPTMAPASMPTLGEARGNIFLLNRINNSYTLGTPMSWSDNTSGSYDRYSNGGGGNLRQFNIWVQDQYEKISSKQKLELFENTWDQKTQGELLINFGSAVQNYIMGVYINEPLLTNLGKVEGAVRQHIVGISLFDYASYTYALEGRSELIDCVALTIDSNFGYHFYSQPYTLKVYKDL